MKLKIGELIKSTIREVKNMEEQETLKNIGIGTREDEKLKPETVKIVKIEIKPVGANNNDKVICHCKHPAREETIQISSVKFEHKNNIKVSGLWVNLDEDKMIKKNSALAVLLRHVQAGSVIELQDKECETSEDDIGYLCLKAY